MYVAYPIEGYDAGGRLAQGTVQTRLPLPQERPLTSRNARHRAAQVPHLHISSTAASGTATRDADITKSHFPMQKFLKMFPRTSSVVISPRMEPRWWRASRRSCAMRSGGSICPGVTEYGPDAGCS